MLSFIVALLLLTLSLLAVILRKVYSLVPAHELKRQAAAGNHLAKELFAAVSYGVSLRVLLWLVLVLASASAFVILAQIFAPLFAILAVALVLWLAFSWLPSSRVTSWSTRLAQKTTPAVVWLLNYLDPLLRRLAEPFIKRYPEGHSGIYEIRDVLDLLDLQSRQPDSRITPEEIELIRQVLQFGDRKVRDVLRPRDQIKSIALNDAIGPIILDELHASGQTVFPVKKSPRSKEIVATLHINDVGLHSKGTVEDYVVPGVTYIHESDSLADALHVFYQTKRQLFVVINSFEEYVGVLTLEDILHTLVGHPAPNESLGSHDDSASVAARHSAVKTESEVAESDETVVE
ncbi:MAG TPA: CBS domain-containing protein [Candidatus Saccharimonadales bacterium]